MCSIVFAESMSMFQENPMLKNNDVADKIVAQTTAIASDLLLIDGAAATKLIKVFCGQWINL